MLMEWQTAWSSLSNDITCSCAGNFDGERGFGAVRSAQVSNNPVEEILEALALLIGKRVAFTNDLAVFVDHKIG